MMQGDRIKMFRAALVLLLGGATILLIDQLIRRWFPVRPILDDLAFRIFPRMSELSILADGVVTLGIVLIFVYSQAKSSRLAQLMFAFGVMMFTRGILTLVTPIGDPSGDSEIYGFLERYPLVGMFPSGHTASLVLELFFVRLWQENKWVLNSWIILLVIEIISLFVTRGHYSIDIVAGAALGYFSYRMALRYS